MPFTLHPVTPGRLDEVVEAVARCQTEEAVQLHPGDLGWNQTAGAIALADSLRVWRRDGMIVAVAMADATDAVVRMAVWPGAAEDEELAARISADLDDPAAGILPAGRGQVEARSGAALRSALTHAGWTDVEPWTPLRRNLSGPVEDAGLRIEVLDARAVHRERRAHLLHDRVALQRAAFTRSTFTEERWRAMAASPAYRQARCLVGYDTVGAPVAAATVWSAGPGRPGLIEPLGTHRDHRGRGHGRAITLACGAALRELGASSMTVCTRATNTAAVATYRSAGMEQLPDATDFLRPVWSPATAGPAQVGPG